jgi:hypothetical protein
VLDYRCLLPGLMRRPRSIDRALAAFNPKLPRRGKIKKGAKRGLIANDGLATTSQLVEWCYPRGKQYWHCAEICRALRALGVKEIGRARAPGRPIIWSIR